MLFDWDWRSTKERMRQANPGKLVKLRKNIADIKGLISEGDSVLDVGCGQGRLCLELFPKGGPYTGVDINEEEIEIAKAGLPEVDFRVMDLYDLKGEWDVVICSRVLIHLPDFKGAMKVLLDCAKKYVVLIVGISIDRAEDEGGVHFRTFSGRTLESVGACEIRKYEPYATVIYRK
jgi:2-polyprenyl-3-methyl-5-hydroxy-6-metoxy-1,4-benzoquinol methylase